ncbi:MAG: phosphodiester glycosidase family protein [Prevotella sp.]|nr:phosphodiester glycosidase family protein [Prevotella sp.]
MDDINMQKPEVPVIIIERDEQSQSKETETKVVAPSWKRKWLKRILALVAVGCMMVAVLAGYKYWNDHNNIGVDVSVSPEQNIEKLQQPAKREVAQVVMTSDTILDVAMDFYAIHGLKASIEFKEPDLNDRSVYLYCRSVDFNVDSTYIGSLVVNGEELQSDVQRFAYMAMVGNNSVIGVSRSEKVKDFVKKEGGSFFRQFILVSNGTIPNHFFLHGKVERRAIGCIDDRLYYIVTRNKETMWDFADALRRYGFIDAIYITGGKDYGFYRTKDGVRHDIGDPANYPHKKWKGVIPWLVFRAIK